MSLGIKCLDTEPWRECVRRYAKEYQLEEEALMAYDRKVAAGTADATAAWEALYEWDLLDYEEDPIEG